MIEPLKTIDLIDCVENKKDYRFVADLYMRNSFNIEEYKNYIKNNIKIMHFDYSVPTPPSMNSMLINYFLDFNTLVESVRYYFTTKDFPPEVQLYCKEQSYYEKAISDSFLNISLFPTKKELLEDPVIFDHSKGIQIHLDLKILKKMYNYYDKIHSKNPYQPLGYPINTDSRNKNKEEDNIFWSLKLVLNSNFLDGIQPISAIYKKCNKDRNETMAEITARDFYISDYKNKITYLLTRLSTFRAISHLEKCNF